MSSCTSSSLERRRRESLLQEEGGPRLIGGVPALLYAPNFVENPFYELG